MQFKLTRFHIVTPQRQSKVKKQIKYSYAVKDIFVSRRKKVALNESPKQEPTTETDKSLQNGSVAPKNVETLNKQNLDTNYNNMNTNEQPPPPSSERRAQEIVMERRRTSLKGTEIAEESVCYRRVSISGNRTTPKKKADCGTHVVSKSELWDTGSQHRCSKSHQNKSRVSISQEEGNANCILCSVRRYHSPLGLDCICSSGYFDDFSSYEHFNVYYH